MQHNKKLTNKFKQFKMRILAESAFDSANTIYGLNKAHIEVILGIPLPLLMESIDRTTRKKILREQFLYEQFMEGTQVEPGAAGFLSGAKHTAQEMFNRVKNIPDNVKTFTEFMTVVLSSPAYLQVFNLEVANKLKQIKASFYETIKDLKKTVEDIVAGGEKTTPESPAETEEEKAWFAAGEQTSSSEDSKKDNKLKLSLAQTVLNGIQQIDSLIQRFDQATGWVKATLGLALAGVLGWINSKYETIAHFVATAGKGAFIGSNVDAKGAAGGAVTTVALDLAIPALKKVAVFFGSNVIESIKSAMTGGLTTLVKIVSTVVGGFATFIRLLSPIFEKVVTVYNTNQTRLVSDKPLEESIKLFDLIFLNEISSTKSKTEKFIRKVRSDLYPILLKQAQFIVYSMNQRKKPSDPDVLNQMNYYMRHYADQNPLNSLDTYGVALLLNYLIKDPKLSGKAKRYYKAAIDAWLKKKV